MAHAGFPHGSRPVILVLCQQTMPAEELYDLSVDPHQVHNLTTSGDAKHQAALAHLRAVLEKWIEQTGDMGRTLEPTAVAAAKGATKGIAKP